MADKYSDQQIPQINLEDYLPEVYRSDINKTMSSMVFDRYLTKDDTVQVTGYVGRRNSASIVNRQIQESSLDTHEQAHRQGFQLTPSMYTKIGTVESALSFKNFLTQLELQGVDVSRLPEWGSALEFNWVPPINIDMLANYQDYFWSSTDVTDLPQYFTVENICNKASDKVAAYETVMLQRGLHFLVVDIDFSSNTFIIDGKWDNIFVSGFNFITTQSTTLNLNDKSWSTVNAIYNSITHKTQVTVYEHIAPVSEPTSSAVGDWWYDSTLNVIKVWDSVSWVQYLDTITAQVVLPAVFSITSSSISQNTLTIPGKQTDLFTPGFVFVTVDSSNINIQNKAWTTSNSVFDELSYSTIITTIEPIAYTNDTPPIPTFVGEWWYNPDNKVLSEWGGSDWNITSAAIIANISLAELLLVFHTDLNCKCHSERGWDIGLWDDNSLGNVAWNAELLSNIRYPDINSWLQANRDNPEMVSNGAPLRYAMWYDTITNQLKQFSASDNWEVVMSNFSAILALTTGQENWDDTIGCTAQTLNQWSSQNSWRHKSAIKSYTSAKRAQIPILEYDSNTEINEWTQKQHAWKYRTSVDSSFTASNEKPSRLELEPVKGYRLDGTNTSWYLYLFDPASTVNANVNLTDTFVPGYKFRIVNDSGSNAAYTTEWSEYRDMSNNPNPTLASRCMATVIKISETAFTSPAVGGPDNARIIPSQTSCGDVWLGYHNHWMLDTTSQVSKPVKPVPINIFKAIDSKSDGTHHSVSGNTAYQDFSPQVSDIVFGMTFQELTINIPNVSQIDLVPSLRYDHNTPNFYATPNSNELRVYVNGVRQYGTYTELLSSGYPSYTVIGIDAMSVGVINYVVGIIFDNDHQLNIGDSVKIEVGPASMADMGMYAVPVRTVEDDIAFADDITQPSYISLTEFELNEQTKQSLNQYPLFNVYDLITGDVQIASPIITFLESPTSPIHSSVQRRITTLNGGIEFEFDQHLLDFDDHILYGYRNISKVSSGQYWYSPLRQTLLLWDGYAWTDKVVVSTAAGYNVVRVPTISATDPIQMHDRDGALWLNTNTQKLYSRIVSDNAWVQVNRLLINNTDPSLQTVWRCGNNQETYVPQYVDKDTNIVEVGSINGDWEVVKQWIYNPEHRNRKTVQLSQLTTHFQTIIAKQSAIQGLIGGGVYSRSHSEYNYGVGGTIKEFNGAFDTLISAVNITNTTPIGVIEYAAEEYNNTIRVIRDMFNRSLPKLLEQYTPDTILNFTQPIIDGIITQYETNEFYASLYGDTSSYDSVTGKGIRNWISTAPRFGLAPLYKPHLLNEDGFTQIFHHDGHRSTVSYTNAEKDALIRQIIMAPDLRVSGTTMGKSGTIVPTTITDFISVYGGNALRTGVYWYQRSPTPVFSRFEMYMASPTSPLLYLGGVELPDGIMYYDTTLQCTMQKVGLDWIEITTRGSGNITPMWKHIDIQLLLGELYLEIETRLYDVCVGVTSVYNYNTLTPTATEQAVYDAKYRSRFDEYVVNFSVPTPFTNTQYVPTDAFTWNYATSVISTPPYAYTMPTSQASCQSLYTLWYNTPYPHLEPWRLQGYLDKPNWWDVEYSDTTHMRRWKSAMWDNVRAGLVPTGRPYPSGIISTGNIGTDNQQLQTYAYMSVNTTNDSLLPPYYPTTDHINRSIFNSIGQIIAPDADYVFGDGSQIEWQWKVSAQHPYDLPIVAFQMQPVRFFRAAFGPKYTLVDNLEVDILFKQVYSHKDTLFHGDLINETELYTVAGLNQWYVNFNRFTGYDTSDNFREAWVGWSPLLTYQFNGIVDTSTLSITNTNFEIIDSDYNVILVNNGAFSDLWVDAFNLSVISIPPAIIQYNNQDKWKIELESLASISRDISYYGVKSYPFTVDINTNDCHAYRYIVTGVDVFANRFYVSGNNVDVFTSGMQIVVSESTDNDGNFTILSSVYEPGTNQTRINVLQSINSNIAIGVINVDSFVFPWSTGDMVVLSSSKTLPAPLVHNTPYYIIAENNQLFKLAETYYDSLMGVSVDILSNGVGIHQVAEIVSSFIAMGNQGHSKDTWYHYALDKSKTHTITPPYVINGMQNLVNIIDGYAEYQSDSGIVFNNVDAGEFDYHTGRQITWALELERFIDWSYGLREARMSINDRYQISVNTTENTITFVDTFPDWVNGTAIQFSATGSLPSPLDASDTYYVYLTSVPGTIKVSASQDVSYTPLHVILTTIGSGNVYVAAKSNLVTYPKFEINPNRNNIWLSTPEGVLSDVVQGPYSDIRINQSIYDQYGRIVDPSNLIVYRQDKRNHITVLPQIQNDVDPYYVDDPYNYLHLGGGHFFVEGYEHFVLFNPYTAGNKLLYDSFFGLFASKFNMTFSKAATRTLRPTLGGYYLKGHEFVRNIEGVATDLHNFYDTYEGSEDSVNIKRARSLMGYSGNASYLDLLNVDTKSQFIFYRGMLHAKGSVSSVMAYINSRRFVDAKIDDYWAIKIAEFGDNRAKIYPEILLTTADGLASDIRFEFLGIGDDITDPSYIDAIDNKGFNLITFADDSRWNNFPEQRAEIVQPLFLDAELFSVSRIFISVFPPPKSSLLDVDFWYNSQTNTLHAWNAYDWSNTVVNKIHLDVDNGYVYWAHSEPCDDVRVVRRDVSSTQLTLPILHTHSSTNTNSISNAFVVKGNLVDDIYNNSSIVVTGAGSGNNGTFRVADSTYDPQTDVTYIIVHGTIPLESTGGSVSYQLMDIKFYSSTHFTSGVDTDQYLVVNSEAVRMGVSSFVNIIHIYSIRPSAHSISPAKLVDKHTGSVISQIPLWHPAYGQHYQAAMHNINLVANSDPAKYTISPSNNNISDHFWNFAEIGTTWLDTSQIGYVPYYDAAINPDINARLYQWGNLAPYASVGVYQWVRSSVPPSNWDATALSQQGNLSIAPNDRLTGNAKKTVFNRSRVITAGSVRFGDVIEISTPDQSLTVGQEIFVTADSELPIELQNNTKLMVLTATQTLPQVVTVSDIITDAPIAIAIPTLLANVVDKGSTNNPILLFESSTNVLTSGDIIKLSTIVGGLLPKPFVPNVEYAVSNVVNAQGSSSQTFSLCAVGTSTNIQITEAEVGTLTVNVVSKTIKVVPSFTDINWNMSTFAKQRLIGAWLPSSVNPTIHWTQSTNNPTWYVDDMVDVYLNGVLLTSGVVIHNSTLNRFEVSTAGTGLLLKPHDFIDVVRPIHQLTASESKFDPNTSDDGVTLVQWKEDYQYSQRVTSLGTNGIANTDYYYWVENTTVKSADLSSMSLSYVRNSLINIPIPYFVVQRPIDSLSQLQGYGYDQQDYGTVWSMGELPEFFYTTPIMYRECIIRNASGYITNDTRYMVQFTRDLTLRDSLSDATTQTNLKDKYSEWVLFRQNQSDNIMQHLWDALVESLSGVSLRTGLPVPSLDRVLYDSRYGSDTQYGLGTGQTFVDKTTGLKTLQSYLQDPTRDFSPIDIDNFLNTNDFTTKSGIQNAMIEIYNTFGSAHVNGIWFEMLQDALSHKAKYKELIKTSWVALHGIRILGVNGMFDE